MPPSEFWGADVWSVTDAYDGFLMSRGVKKAEGQPFTEDDMEELDRLIREDEARMKKGRHG